ncbi:uncharacterized protein BDR25DRAFT_363154 [Lindgomyces ingoldianus]|uniref:Uncharacterized protein n=1 Tax=Lindgomyces ingoldianus TaxID=673940 RepID=A0ACB6Q877_9PLEO|nr:uncharacterized protein BDR25DRAFT_363154 [Lindgomyces ingoldianus]KAF2463067.1 hypothetical protein BDR25DRAFT_363154 [Lindgomyces ingoldianus]
MLLSQFTYERRQSFSLSLSRSHALNSFRGDYERECSRGINVIPANHIRVKLACSVDPDVSSGANLNPTLSHPLVSLLPSRLFSILSLLLTATGIKLDKMPHLPATSHFQSKELRSPFVDSTSPPEDRYEMLPNLNCDRCVKSSNPSSNHDVFLGVENKQANFLLASPSIDQGSVNKRVGVSSYATASKNSIEPTVPRDPSDPRARVLCISNLHFHAKEDEVRNFFFRFEVIDYTRYYKPETKKPLGYGFIMTASASAAQRAKGWGDGKTLHGRTIEINFARECPEGEALQSLLLRHMLANECIVVTEDGFVQSGNRVAPDRPSGSNLNVTDNSIAQLNPDLASVRNVKLEDNEASESVQSIADNHTVKPDTASASQIYEPSFQQHLHLADNGSVTHHLKRTGAYKPRPPKGELRDVPYIAFSTPSSMHQTSEVGHIGFNHNTPFRHRVPMSAVSNPHEISPLPPGFEMDRVKAMKVFPPNFSRLTPSQSDGVETMVHSPSEYGPHFQLQHSKVITGRPEKIWDHRISASIMNERCLPARTIGNQSWGSVIGDKERWFMRRCLHTKAFRGGFGDIYASACVAARSNLNKESLPLNVNPLDATFCAQNR